jgi:hypothetical protein
MNKILLVDVDSKIPNLALMKLSTYHKSLGDLIDIQQLYYSGYPDKRKETIIDAKEYDKVYVSIIFTINNNWVKIKNCNQIYYGGTGYDLFITLPPEIDNCKEDYSIYPDNKISYGFLTRGCVRNCSFCFVPKKEGKLKFYRTVDQIKQHNIIEFLDNNFLAYEECENILQELIDKNIRCNFNQGLDIRLITPKIAELLSKLNYKGEYIFAFDNIKYKSILEEKIKILQKYIQKDWKIKLFVLVGFDSTLSEDLERIKWCQNHKILPYIMRHEKCWLSENKNFYTDLASYCNQPAFFKKMNFEQFMLKRTTNIDRQKKSIELWNSSINQH